MQYVPLFPHNFGFRPFVDGSVQAPPPGYAGLVGPAPGEARVVNGRADAPRQYFGLWAPSGLDGGIYYAAYYPSSGGSEDGSQYFDLPFFTRTATTVTIELLKDPVDRGTGVLAIGEQTVSFDSTGPSLQLLPIALTVPAGEHTLRVRKLLGKSLYVRNVFFDVA